MRLRILQLGLNKPGSEQDRLLPSLDLNMESGDRFRYEKRKISYLNLVSRPSSDVIRLMLKRNLTKRRYA